MFSKNVKPGRGHAPVELANAASGSSRGVPIRSPFRLPPLINLTERRKQSNVTTPIVEAAPETVERKTEREMEAAMPDANVVNDVTSLKNDERSIQAENLCGLEPPPWTMKRYELLHSVGPDEFYMMLEEDKILFDEFVNEMKKSKALNILQSPERSKINMVYAYFERLSRKWCRVKLLSISSTNDGTMNYGRVYNLEQNRNHFAFLEMLRCLPERFANRRMPIIRCFLQDVLPSIHPSTFRPSSSKSNAQKLPCWPAKAVHYFNKLIQHDREPDNTDEHENPDCESELLGEETWSFEEETSTAMNKPLPLPTVWNVLPMSWTEVEPISGSKSLDNSPSCTMGVIIFDTADDKTCINWKMVESGHAVSIGPGATSSTMLYLPGMMPDYGKQENQGLFEFKSTDDGKIPEYTSSHFCQVKLSFVNGPGCIFVHMKSKLDELEKLEKDLAIELTRLQPVEPSGIKVGLPVLHDETKGGKHFVYRAVITKNADEKTSMIEIVSVDYGMTKSVFPCTIYPLPQRFQEIPSFAIRTHLSEIRPFDATNSGLQNQPVVWSLGIWKVLLSLTRCLAVDVPSYYAYTPQHGGMVNLKRLMQEVMFDYQNEKWVPAENICRENFISILTYDITQNKFMEPLLDTGGADVPEEFRNSPLLASHFVSHGVELVYEAKQKIGSTCKECEYLTDLLIDPGYAKLINSRLLFDTSVM